MKDFCLFISLPSPTSSRKIRPNWRFISNHSRYNPIGPQFNSIRENCAQINFNPNQIFSLKVHIKIVSINEKDELDPVGSTVRYEVMKLCTGSSIGQQWMVLEWYWVSMRQHHLIIDGSGSVSGLFAFIIYIEQSGDLVGCYWSLKDRLTRKDRATQLLRRRSEALVMQSVRYIL